MGQGTNVVCVLTVDCLLASDGVSTRTKSLADRTVVRMDVEIIFKRLDGGAMFEGKSKKEITEKRIWLLASVSLLLRATDWLLAVM